MFIINNCHASNDPIDDYHHLLMTISTIYKCNILRKISFTTIDDNYQWNYMSFDNLNAYLKGFTFSNYYFRIKKLICIIKSS